MLLTKMIHIETFKNVNVFRRIEDSSMMILSSNPRVLFASQRDDQNMQEQFFKKSEDRSTSEKNNLLKFVKSFINSTDQGKKVDDQTIYTNIRSHIFKNQQRKAQYFENIDQKLFLNDSEVQNKLFLCQKVDALIKLYHGHKFTFSTKNLITLIHRIGRFYPIERKKNRQKSTHKRITLNLEKQIQPLLFNLNENIELFSPVELVLIGILLVWSLTRLNLARTDLYLQCINILLQKLETLILRHLALLIWCLAKTSNRNPKLYAMICMQIENNLNSIRVQSIQQNHQIDDSETQIEKKIDGHSLALIAWSLNQQNISDSVLEKKIKQLSIENIHLFGLQEIFMIIQSLNKHFKQEVNLIHHDNFEDWIKIEKNLLNLDLSKEKSLTIKTVINILNKIKDQNKCQNEELFEKMFKNFFQKNQNSISPRFLCEILSAIVNQNVLNTSFLKRALSEIKKNINIFNAQDCISALESLSKFSEFFEEKSLLKTRLEMYKKSLKPKQFNTLKKFS